MDYYSNLGRIDSSTFGNLASQSMKANDIFALNMTFSMGRNNSRFHDLNRQPTNMSQVSVGGFKIRKDTAINDHGDVIVSQYFDFPKQEDFAQDLDNIMFNNSINVSGKQFTNNLHGSFGENDKNQNANDFNLPMTSSQEMDTQEKTKFRSQIMNRSIANHKKNFDDILLDQSASIRQQMNNNLVSVNLTQFQNENMMRHSNAKYGQIMPISLMDKKIETLSEPDIDITHYDFIHSPNEKYNKYQNKDNSSGFGSNTGLNTHKGIRSNLDLNSSDVSNQNNQQMKESVNPGLTIEPFTYSENQLQQQIYAHSDDEQPTKKSPVKLKTLTDAKKNQQKGSQYRQSRHKNVFKNFGGTLIRFIVYNQYFQDRVIQELQNEAQKQKGFYDWLQTEIKLERKKDFQIAWTTFKTDSDKIREYKALLRELSRDFFENFSFIYLINSKKISDMEIHLRSIHTYLAAINNPDSLERFKPV